MSICIRLTNRPFLSGKGSYENIDIDFFVTTWPECQAKLTMSEYTLPSLAGFASKREAKKYEEDFIENLIMPEETEIEPIRTFGEVFQEYLMSHKRADIKESTLETKFNIFNKHIFPTFEEKQVDTITDDDIANWQNEIKSVVQPNGKHFSESYLRTIQSQFNSIINYALNKGYMGRTLRNGRTICCMDR